MVSYSLIQTICEHLSQSFYDILDQHDAIAWDFDGTLWGGPLATLMHEYIRQNQHKRHVIMTFRSGKRNKRVWAEMVWDDLAGSYENPVTREHFEGVINMDEETFELNCVRRSPGGIILDATDIYREWKGMMCAKHGFTLLVDDNPDHTKPGCDKYGIAYVDPADHM